MALDRRGENLKLYTTKTQTFELKKMGLSKLTETENHETNGGVVWWLPAALVIGLVVSAVNNFGDIREGLSDGWNGTPRH